MKFPYRIRPVVLEINADRQGKYAIKICVYERATERRIYRDTDHRVLSKHWDAKNRYVKRTDPEHLTINSKIQKQIQDLEKSIHALIDAKKPVNIQALLDAGDYNSTNIFDYAETFLAESAGKFKKATINARKLDMKRLKKYSGPGLTFDQVDKAFLRRLEKHLRDSLSNNTVHRVFKSMKKIFNAAIGDGITANYPFKGNDNPKYVQTKRTFLTKEELDKFSTYVFGLQSKTMKVSGLYFLLGCYSALRVSDWHRFGDDMHSMIRGEQLILYAEKNNEIVSMPVKGTLKRIIDELVLIGNKCPAEQTINQYIKLIAEAEDVDIKKHLTTHVARHTYGTSCARNGIPPVLAARRMGITLETVMVYYHIMGATVKEAFEKMDEM